MSIGPLGSARIWAILLTVLLFLSACGAPDKETTFSTESAEQTSLVTDGHTDSAPSSDEGSTATTETEVTVSDADISSTAASSADDAEITESAATSAAETESFSVTETASKTVESTETDLGNMTETESESESESASESETDSDTETTEPRRQDVVYFATPILDGLKDDAYDSVSAVGCATTSFYSSFSECMGIPTNNEITSYYLWDGQYFYVYMHVVDHDLLKADDAYIYGLENPWRCDAIEIFYAMGHKPSAALEPKKAGFDAFGRAVFADSATSVEKSNWFADIEFAAVYDVEAGYYAVEAKIPAKTETGLPMIAGDSVYVSLENSDLFEILGAYDGTNDAAVFKQASFSDRLKYPDGYVRLILSDTPAP